MDKVHTNLGQCGTIGRGITIYPPYRGDVLVARGGPHRFKRWLPSPMACTFGWYMAMIAYCNVSLQESKTEKVRNNLGHHSSKGIQLVLCPSYFITYKLLNQLPISQCGNIGRGITTAMSRAIQSLAKKKLNAVFRSPSYVALDIHGAIRSLVFDVDAEVYLSTVVKEKSLDDLHRLGGVEGLVDKLASIKAGIVGSTNDLQRREEMFGSNTCPKPKRKGFFRFMYEALNDLFLVILIVCAVVALGFGIKENGIRDGC